MAVISPSVPSSGQPRGGEEIDVTNALAALLSEFNGNIDAANIKDGSLTSAELGDALAAVLGISTTSGVRRGKSIIATSESRTNAAYGLMPTPDRVSSVVLPTDGLLKVFFQATWQESVAAAARAAVFIGANQLQVGHHSGVGYGPVTNAAATGAGNANRWTPLIAAPGIGLASGFNQGAFDVADDATTGQVAGFDTGSLGFGYEANGTVQSVDTGRAKGGPIYVFAAAGTYDISVQFKSATGSVTVKSRKLWVEAVGFG